MDGLSQNAHDFVLPKVIAKKRGITDVDVQTLDKAFPPDEYLRLLAHPPSPSDQFTDGTKRQLDTEDELPPLPESLRLHQIDFGTKKKVVVAVGPEGGYTRRELAHFLDNDFKLINMGVGVLRTDVAVIGLLALCRERLASLVE